MTSDDVKHLLQSVADQGAAKVQVDEHTLVPRIRRRRFRRTATIGVASIATAAVIVVSASAILPGRGNDTPVAAPSTPVQPIPTTFPPVPFTCGTLFPAPSAIGVRNVVIKQKNMTRTATGWTGTLDYTITNDDPQRRTWVNDWGNDELVVVLENKLVAKATMTAGKKTTDLRPGKTLTFRVRIDIRSCGAVSGLPADSYLFYSDIPVQGKLLAGTVQEVEPLVELQLN